MSSFLPNEKIKDLVADIRNKLSHIGNNQHNIIDKLENNLEKYLIIETAKIKDQLLQNAKYMDPKNLIPFGFKVFSENDEDGMIEEIFNRIGCKNKTFIEFGVGDGLENNTLYLLHKNWSGLWIEANCNHFEEIKKNVSIFVENNQLKISNQFLSLENINKTFIENEVTGEIDLLVIDIDGNDYHLLEAISVVAPRVVVIEYNGKFPANFSWIMEYDKDYRWKASSYYGASLKAYENLMRKKSYSLVGCNIVGNNAFFVRNDLISSHFQSPYTAEKHYEPVRYWLNIGCIPDRNFKTKIGPFI